MAETSDGPVYNGDELHHAAERSYIDLALFVDAAPPSGWRRFTHDIRGTNLRTLWPRSCVVTGTEPDSGAPLNVRFVGRLGMVDTCAAALFGRKTYRRETRRVAAPDILISDHPLAHPLLRRSRSIRTPPWVRQQLQLAETWEETLSAMRPSLRREIGRILRRHRYKVRLSAGDEVISDYYRRLHAPYLSSRFGPGAILTTEPVFHRNSRHMTRIDLIYEDLVVAASLLERTGDRLAIRCSSMNPESPSLHGRADALDYFCLLIAQLAGCMTLDFGLSRPELDDGALRYKSKWGAILTDPGGLKADVCIAPLRRTPATLAVLRRNRFLQRDTDGYFLRVLFDGPAAERGIDELMPLRGVRGLTRVELAYDPNEGPPTAALDSFFSASPIQAGPDPLRLALAER